MLIQFDTEKIFRHSIVAKYDVYNIASGYVGINTLMFFLLSELFYIMINFSNSTSIGNGNKLQNCVWSPAKNRLSYVYNNNVYIVFENLVELPITSEGVNGVIYNGIADWVYEEEVLASSDAMWWSPDGNKLAVGFFNDSNVHSYKYLIYGGKQYPTEIDLKYPKPGTQNPYASLKVFDLNNEKPQSAAIKAPTERVTADNILQNVVWSDNDTLLVIWLNRRQNVSSIESCTYSGDCHEVSCL